jgi:hypothetical protein
LIHSHGKLGLPREPVVGIRCQVLQNVIQHSEDEPLILTGYLRNSIHNLRFELRNPLAFPTNVSQCNQQILNASLRITLPISMTEGKTSPLLRYPQLFHEIGAVYLM